MKRFVGFLLILTLVLALVPSTAAQDYKPFERQKIVVVTQVGRSIGGPVEDFAPDWEEMTGGDVELQQFAWGDLFEKTITAFDTGSGDFDMLIFPAAWSGDYMDPGYLDPVPQEILDKVEMDDVIPLYRERIIAWGDTVYALPYDGDSHMLYYRKDLVDGGEYAADFEAEYGYPLAEPETWTQYYRHRRVLQRRMRLGYGPDLRRDGSQKRNTQAFWVYLSHAAGYGKVPGNPCFFFSCDDMTPQVNNPGWVRALEDYIEVWHLGPPEQVNWDVADTRNYFPDGLVGVQHRLG